MVILHRYLRSFAVILMALSSSAPRCAAATGRAEPQVVVGAGTRWVELLPNPEQWEFVRANADGFYVNFIGMDHAAQVKFNDMAKLMTHKVAFLESDMRDATAAADQRSLLMLQIAGFAVPYTSLNYGWSRERSNNLKTFALPAGQARRLCVVQEGPWTLGGDILHDWDSNAEKRSYIDQDDGDSTDGVMGFWQADTKGMRSGSYSMVKYAHARGKRSLVMVTPYAAKISTYDPDKDFLATAQECVRQHENAGASPDYWSVFEYATHFPLLPETGPDGRPADTLTGMAYWLIHHLRDPQHWARLEFMPSPGDPAAASMTTSGVIRLPVAPLVGASLQSIRTIALRLHNDSPWLDLCPAIRATVDPIPGNTAHCTLDGEDVTTAMLGRDGVACVGNRRMWPQSTRELLITVPVGATPANVTVELFTHPTAAPDQVRQRTDFRLLPMTPAALSSNHAAPILPDA